MKPANDIRTRVLALSRLMRQAALVLRDKASGPRDHLGLGRYPEVTDEVERRAEYTRRSDLAVGHLRRMVLRARTLRQRRRAWQFMCETVIGREWWAIKHQLGVGGNWVGPGTRLKQARKWGRKWGQK